MSAADTRDALIHNYLELAPITFLYYDHALTFSEEVRRIWRAPLSKGSLWFLFNRYLAFFGNLAILFVTFTNWVTATKRCEHYGLFRELLLLVTQIVICVMLGLRTCALYGNTRRVIAAFVGLVLVLLPPAAFSLTGPHSTVVPGVQGCHLATSRLSGIYLAIAWEVLLVYDIAIFTLTVIKSWRTRTRRDLPFEFSRSSVLDLIVRDGAIYFGVITVTNAINILTLYVCPPILKGLLSTVASCVSVTMVSRLLLNLHSAVSPILEPDDLTVDSTSHGGLTILSAATDERGSHSIYETYEMRVGLAF